MALILLAFLRRISDSLLVGAAGVLSILRGLLGTRLARLVVCLLLLLVSHKLRLLALNLRVELLDVLARCQIGHIRLISHHGLVCAIGLLRCSARVAVAHLRQLRRRIDAALEWL